MSYEQYLLFWQHSCIELEACVWEKLQVLKDCEITRKSHGTVCAGILSIVVELILIEKNNFCGKNRQMLLSYP